MISSIHVTAPTPFVEVDGAKLGSRSFASHEGVPIFLLNHSWAGMDHLDPVVDDGLARSRRVIPVATVGLPGSLETLRDVPCSTARHHQSSFPPNQDQSSTILMPHGATIDLQIDAASAQIADHFLAARSDRGDARVAAAYAELVEQSDGILAALSSAIGPTTTLVVFTKCSNPYLSDDEMITAARVTGVLEISSVVTERERQHPLLGNELGGSYDRFRAVHDLLGHVRSGSGFDREGERDAWLAQDQFYRGLARLALATELRGEYCVLLATGDFADHKATLLESTLFDRQSAPTPTSWSPRPQWQ